MDTGTLQVCVKYSMCDLIYDAINNLF